MKNLVYHPKKITWVMADTPSLGQPAHMIDPLFARASLAIEESYTLRDRRRALMTDQDAARDDLRLAIFESAMLRTEIKASRDDKQ